MFYSPVCDFVLSLSTHYSGSPFTELSSICSLSLRRKTAVPSPTVKRVEWLWGVLWDSQPVMQHSHLSRLARPLSSPCVATPASFGSNALSSHFHAPKFLLHRK